MMPMGREPMGPAGGPIGAMSAPQASNSGSMSAVAQLFARLSQEIEENKPKNCVHFIVDFLCKHYPEHLHGFASIWQMDPDLERERHEVVDFFKSHKISTAVAAHFTNAGYDTLDTLTTLSPDSLVDVEAFNNVKWLPGHKVRLQQIFAEITARVRAYRQQNPRAGAPASPRERRPLSPMQPARARPAIAYAAPAPLALPAPAPMPMATTVMTGPAPPMATAVMTGMPPGGMPQGMPPGMCGMPPQRPIGPFGAPMAPPMAMPRA
mmetsp:Transcript_43813/g.101219  ORF Transcript_43813/g.101219 Transcript_43813/m.101219 type:complete len:265 (+) Transcript_43813:98-892(+)